MECGNNQQSVIDALIAWLETRRGMNVRETLEVLATKVGKDAEIRKQALIDCNEFVESLVWIDPLNRRTYMNVSAAIKLHFKLEG